LFYIGLKSLLASSGQFLFRIENDWSLCYNTGTFGHTHTAMFPTRSGGSLNDDINAIYASMFQQPHQYDHHYDHHHFGRSLLADAREDGLARGPESWKYGVGGYQPPTKIGYNLTDAVVVATDWVGFLALMGAAIVLIYKLFTFKGPDGEEYYVGYREEKCLSVFVNLIAALTYWGRICAHFNGDIGLSLTVNFYKYFDYIFTCPVLVRDPHPGNLNEE
jgi:hypothetical protein